MDQIENTTSTSSIGMTLWTSFCMVLAGILGLTGSWEFTRFIFIVFFIPFAICRIKNYPRLMIAFASLSSYVLLLSMYAASWFTWEHIHKMYSTSSRHHMFVVMTFIVCFPVIVALLRTSISAFLTRAKKGSIGRGVSGGLLAVAIFFTAFYLIG